MNGFLLIDKPEGITSFGVVSRVRKILGIKKVGHCGTLDPQATGLLIICLGKATKLAQFVSKQNKEYLAEITLGYVSTTLDRDGELTAHSPETKPTLEEILTLLTEFTGDIEQVAPAYSAVKHQGQPLYKYARKNQSVEEKIRHVHVSEINITAYEYPHLCIEVICSSGTYIRSIAHDLGQRLNCGGYISKLRRAAIGRWRLESAIRLDELEERLGTTVDGAIDVTRFSEAYVPIENMLEIPTLRVLEPRTAQVLKGVPIRIQDVFQHDEPLDLGQLVAVRAMDGELLAIGRMRCGSVAFGGFGDEPLVEYVRVI
jgi:tRNA pseudouridine55 synthase